jgi:hypothetical protein
MFEGAPPGDLVEAIAESQRQESVLVARRLAAVAELLGQRTAEAEAEDPDPGYMIITGFQRTTAEVAAAMNLSPMAASFVVSHAEALDTRLPKVAAVLAEGKTDWRTVQLIIARTELVTDSQVVARLDANLAARLSNWHCWSRKRIINAVDAAVRAHDPDAIRERQAAEDRRRVDVTALGDGTAKVDGVVATEAAVAFDRRLSELAAAVCPADPRDMAQRRADAMGALAEGRRLACECGAKDCQNRAEDAEQSGGTRLVINVIANQQTSALRAAFGPESGRSRRWDALSVVSGRRWLSVPAARMVGMGRRLRAIGDPMVAGAPAGVRIRTRIHPTAAEAEALAVIGELLGSVYRGELAERVRLGRLDRRAHASWRAQRKRALTAVSSSRWAGAITRAVEDQYQLGMRSLAAQVADLRAAVDVLEARCALRPGALAPVEDTHTHGRSRSRRRGYRTAAERFTKTRRLAVLRPRLATAEQALAAGRPSITVGGKRLWRNRNHLDAAGMVEQQWRQKWDAARMFLIADGESGKAGGNETIRVDESGRLRIKVPAALVDQFGTRLVIAAPVQFSHLGAEWSARVAARHAVRYDISYDPGRRRWYLDASWTTSPGPVPELDDLRTGAVLGVDLNADHVAACVLDSSGNPVGEPVTIAVDTPGLRASRRDGRVRAAISMLLDHAHLQNCSAIVVENLDFVDARATGRETLGRGKRGKRLRRTVAGIPTGKFRIRLTGMAARRGIAIIGVDPAYTSRWGAQHWRKPLQQQTSDPATVTAHHGAAAAIGRRGLGLAIRRRPAGPRTRQRTSAGTSPARPDHQPSTTPRRCRSSGSPPRPLRRGVPVHRTTPTASGQHRSGRTGLTPAQ